MRLLYSPGACSLSVHVFALGEAFSVADAYLVALARHARTVGDRPAVRAAMRAEGLLQE